MWGRAGIDGRYIAVLDRKLDNLKTRWGRGWRMLLLGGGVIPFGFHAMGEYLRSDE